MGRLLVFVFFVLSWSFSNVSPIQAQGIRLSNVWNAGAIIIDVQRGSDRNPQFSYGQGYLAYDDESEELRVYTIQHVIEGASRTWVNIPEVRYQEIDTNRWSCVARRGDDDMACYFVVSPEATRSILRGDEELYPYIRLNNSGLQVGDFVGSPRPDTGRWTVYEVVAIRSQEIEIEAVWAEIQGTVVPLGNFCHGRSGGPLVPLELDGNTFIPLLHRSGFPMVVGELQEGNDDGYPDYINPENTCYYNIIVNRVER